MLLSGKKTQSLLRNSVASLKGSLRGKGFGRRVSETEEHSVKMVYPGADPMNDGIVRTFSTHDLPPAGKQADKEKNVKMRMVQPSLDRPYSSPRLNAVRNSSLNKRPAIPPQLAEDRGKLTVILDVDETLIHSRLSSHQEQYRQVEDRKEAARALDEFTITLADGEVVHVNKRPGLDKFLEQASQTYELFAYTAGLEEYARPLLDWLDPKGTIFRHRLYRDSCLFMRGYYLKDLQKVNRPLSRCVLVDNNAFCFLPQLSNGIPISSFYDDPNDSALSVLSTFLERIRNESDVRPFLRKSFKLETLLRDHREQIVG